MQNSRSDVLSRLGDQSIQRFPRVEFVHKGAMNRVNQRNGKPYDRPAAASSAGVKPAANGIVIKKRIRSTKKPGKFGVKRFGVIFSGLTPIHTNPTIDPPPRVCYNCWQPGHSRKDCSRPVVGNFCKNCGRRGVEMNTCPRCQEAYKNYLVERNDKLEDLGFEDHDLIENGGQFQMVYNDDKLSNDASSDVLQQLIEQEDQDREMSNYYDEHEREVPYTEPHVKYVETREYVRNPVSRYRECREYEEEEERVHRREDYDYEARDRSYDERDREEYPPRYRKRESSEDLSITERYKRAGNASFGELDSDPVQEVLQLAKSIAHLSPETQEMIMKQVMAERKEKARLRAVQHIVDGDWP